MERDNSKIERMKNIIMALLIVIIMLLIALIVLVITDKVNYKWMNNGVNNTDNNNSNGTNNNNDNSFDYRNIIFESGYTEVTLTDDEKARINGELYSHFNPSSDNSWFQKTLRSGKDSTKNNLFLDDCEKIGFTMWYINHNNIAEYKYETFNDKDELGNELTKIKFNRLEEITKEIFNVDNLSCDEYKDKEYLFLTPGGGGAGPFYAVKVLNKYKNSNNYYLIIHMYEYWDGKLDSLTDYKNDESITGKYIKLKYGVKDDNTKYLISFEYLN